MKFLDRFKNLKFMPIILVFIFVALIGVLLLQILIIQRNKSIESQKKVPAILVESSKNDSEEETFKKSRSVDGVFIPEEEEELYPIAVTIENNIDARPQSGLNKANLVVEAPVEGGITRFLAIFADSEPVEEIGPVRSARPYFLDWVKEFSALYAHVGGSPEALKLIKSDKILTNLDQYFMSQYYWRSSKKPRPHNVYTSTELLAEAVNYFSLGKPSFESWVFKDDLPLENRQEQGDNILIDFSTYANRVEWKYDKENNDYIRYQAGEKHLTKENEWIRAKNVIVQKTGVISIDSEDRKKIKTIGEGEAIMFLDGQPIKGSWEKESAIKRTKFYNKEGEEIKFNRGIIWIEVVSNKTRVEY